MARKNNRRDQIPFNIQNALNDLNDFEVQRIKEKYSKRSLNPFTNKKNKQKLIEEVDELLFDREIARQQEEERIKKEHKKVALLNTIEKGKTHIRNNPRKYLILSSIAVAFIAGFSIFNKIQSTVRTINFAFSDEEKTIGDYIDLNYVVEPNTAKIDDSDMSIIFSNNDLVKYDQTQQNYNCIKEGTLTVKLLYKNKEYDNKTIDIKPILVNKLYFPDIELGRGNSITVEPIIEPSNATNKDYTMSIKDSSIATIEGNQIHGVSLGKTQLRLESADGFTYDVNINIIDIEPKSISINGLKTQYVIGDTAVASISYTPTETTLKNVVWNSSDENVLSVDATGKIIAKEKGVATLTAHYNDSIENSIEITVDYPSPSEIAITNTEKSLTVGNSLQLYTTISPEKVSDSTVRWTSSNRNVAEVNENGVLYAKDVGKATIYAKTINGKTSTIDFTIEAAPIIATMPAMTGEITRSGSEYQTNNIMVWIPATGDKYHSINNCGRMNPNKASQVSIDWAIQHNYAPCSKCIGG